MAFVLVGFGIFFLGFLVAAVSIAGGFFSGNISLRGFGIGFVICIPGVALMALGMILGGAEVLTQLGLF